VTPVEWAITLTATALVALYAAWDDQRSKDQ